MAYRVENERIMWVMASYLLWHKQNSVAWHRPQYGGGVAYVSNGNQRWRLFNNETRRLRRRRRMKMGMNGKQA